MLAEPDVRTADHIVLTGDITAGPQPTQVLDLLTSLGDHVIWISGTPTAKSLNTAGGKGVRSPTRSPAGPPNSSARTTWIFSARCHDHSPCP